MIKYIFIFFTLTFVWGCGGTDCTYSLCRKLLKERMKSQSCIKTYDTIDNKVFIEVTDTLTGELLDRKVRLLK